jgi:Spy/CpxP family protein refolding chaperone
MIRHLIALTAAAAVAFAVTGLTAVSTVAPAFAQAAQGAPAAGQRQRFGQMLLSLKLSDAQKSQIRSIIADARQKNQSVTDPQVKRANMRAAYAQVRTVLTPAQQAKLQSEMAAARAERESGDHS